VFSKSESADFRKVRGLGLGRQKSSENMYYVLSLLTNIYLLITGYGNQYGSGYGHRRRGMLLDEFDCIGGCPMQAFCDYGVCRCRNGYDARYGSCWKRYEDFEKQNWDERKQPAYVPYKSCSDHQQCRQTDMNMVCKQDTQTCQCRDTMKWNDEALECQVFMDVNCTDVSTVESPVVEVNTTTVIKQPTAVNEEEFKFDDSFIYTNTTEGAEGLNITSVTADEVSLLFLTTYQRSWDVVLRLTYFPNTLPSPSLNFEVFF
jgi:hypothetical protein